MTAENNTTEFAKSSLRVAFIVVPLTISLLIVISNTLVFITFKRMRNFQAQHYFMIGIAVADMMTQQSGYGGDRSRQRCDIQGGMLLVCSVYYYHHRHHDVATQHYVDRKMLVRPQTYMSQINYETQILSTGCHWNNRCLFFGANCSFCGNFSIGSVGA